MAKRAGGGARPTRDAIIDAAERAILLNGYKSLNFRDVAADVGIKSSSVHYHFPTKGDLAAEVMRRYREDFAARLMPPDPGAEAAQTALNAFIDGFKDQVVKSGSMSLCVVLSAERNLLDDATKNEVKAFYQLKLSWLSEIVAQVSGAGLDRGECQCMAARILASLHGASVIVKATDDRDLYEMAVDQWRDLAGQLARLS